MNPGIALISSIKEIFLFVITFAELGTTNSHIEIGQTIHSLRIKTKETGPVKRKTRGFFFK